MRNKTGAVIAPAGHGKTYSISLLCRDLPGRGLILTHTNAGANALGNSLRKQGIPIDKYIVKTIDSFCLTFCQRYKRLINLQIDGFPQGAQWSQLRVAMLRLLRNKHIAAIIKKTYGFVLVDEYQDCSLSQHNCILELQKHIPVCVLGDPMQNIFSWAAEGFNWAQHVEPHFPTLFELETPFRWKESNPDLGQTIASIRSSLQRGETIGWNNYSPHIEPKYGVIASHVETILHEIRTGESIAIVHAGNRTRNYRFLVERSAGAVQPAETVALAELKAFIESFLAAKTMEDATQLVLNLLQEIYTGLTREPQSPLDTALSNLYAQNTISTLLECFKIEEKFPSGSKPKIKRKELLQEIRNSLQIKIKNPEKSLSECADISRISTSQRGRPLYSKTIGSTLLLKGLQFEKVIVLYPEEMTKEDLYVSISRATHKVIILTQCNAYNPQ